jgi:hypothetical protein
MVWKAFRDFHAQYCVKMLYCIKYIKAIVQLSRHFCGAGEDFFYGSYAVADEHVAGHALSATVEAISCHAEWTRSISEP